jgi:UDP-N-acetylglucosamine 2-epimerase (non-hydrolysing)
MSSPRSPTGARPRIVLIAGTRPECLKLASLHAALRERAEVLLLSSGQHPDMVARTCAHLGLVPDETLPAIPQPAALSRSVRHLRDALRDALQRLAPDAAIVQGDTSTAYAGALAARLAGVPLGHLEAGLRTDDPRRPFPEEPFRRRIAPLARWHFAPTPRAAGHLRDEGIAPGAIEVVGNPIVDLLRETLAVETPDPCPTGWRERFTRVLTLTLHRRENYGRGLDVVCGAMRTLLDTHPDLGLVCPVHPNPAIGLRMRRQLGDHPRALLVAPLDYRPFVRLLAASSLVVTDSGGIQEEVPYLGVPTLVVRESTERPECLAGGVVRLVPPQPAALLAAIDAALAQPRPRPVPFDAAAPFGDGRSGERVAARLLADLALPRRTAGAMR